MRTIATTVIAMGLMCSNASGAEAEKTRNAALIPEKKAQAAAILAPDIRNIDKIEPAMSRDRKESAAMPHSSQLDKYTVDPCTLNNKLPACE